MDKSELLRRMRDGYPVIDGAALTMSEDALHAEPVGMAGWTRKDVLAHIAWWHRHSTLVLKGIRSGVDPYPDDEGFDLDALNARVLAENRERSDAEVREDVAASFNELVNAVDAATDRELFEAGVVPWLNGTAAQVVASDTFEHYPDHEAQLFA